MGVCRILINDLDNCTTGLGKFMKGSEHFLSEILVKHAKSTQYEGFYACTHRCYSEVRLGKLVDDHHKKRQAIQKWWCHNKKLNKKMPSEYQHVELSEFYPEDIFTPRIVDNFAAATKLTCFAVSTPDDAKECGYGYENILKPFELNVMATKKIVKEKRIVEKEIILADWADFDFDQPLDLEHEYVNTVDLGNKNKQLIQIAKDAKKRFPGRRIILDFVDDKKDILSNALRLDPADLSGVELNLYNHDCFDQTPLQFYGSIKSTKVVEESKNPQVDTASVKLFKTVSAEAVAALSESKDLSAENKDAVETLQLQGAELIWR